jgi:hypothetical protein
MRGPLDVFRDGPATVTSERALTPSSGLVIVRIAWISAILFGVLAILIGLLSGPGGSSGGSSQRAFDPGFAFAPQANAKREQTPAPPAHRSRRPKREVHVDSPAAPARSVSQPVDSGGRAPVRAPPSVPAPQPRPTPRPKPAPAPPQAPVSAPPAAPAAVQTPVTVANNNDGP